VAGADPRPRRRLRVAVAVAVPVLLLAGCTGAAGSDRLTIYSGRGESLVAPVLEQFNEETGIGIDVRYGDSAELALLIDEEGDATPADVFYSQTPGATGFLAANDRLAELPDGVLNEVDEQFRGAGGQWVGVTGRQRVLVYNSDVLDESDLPPSVLDVNEEPWAGRVAVAPSNGSFQDFVTALRQTEGEDVARAWLEGLAAADAPTYANNNAIVEAVGRGEVDMGLVNHYYNYRFLEEDPDLPSRNHVFGGNDIGALLIDSTAAVTAASDDPDAQRLIEYLLSADAQRFFADETKEYPLAAGVEPADDVPPLDTSTIPSVQINELGGGLTDTLELIRTSGLSG
jgi:iron(III) transport system substrate-binding protein